MGGASIIGIVNQKGGTGKTTSCVKSWVLTWHRGKEFCWWTVIPRDL